ncbi:MAG: hypothetical protein HY721_01275 [Planctomycetes bacterium]|nr:hypothetical protein [Planctomycetota bacterium]
MKRFLGSCVVLGIGVALGRTFEGVPTTVAAGGGSGGGGPVERCTSQNGDVNADGRVDTSDAITILGYLFLGSPSQLVPVCSEPPAAEVPSDSILGVLLVLFDLVDGLGEEGLPPSCGSSPAVCCPGGNPLPQCGPLRFELAEAPSVFTSSDPSRFPFTLRMRVQTVSDLPVSLPIAGDCGIRIDTTPGVPFVDLRSEMVFRQPTPDDGRPVVFSQFVLEGFEDEDVTLTGGLGCTVASFGLGLSKDLVVSVVENRFLERSLVGLCQPRAGCQPR